MRRAVLIGWLFLCGSGLLDTSVAQQFPRWFLNPTVVDCDEQAVGFARQSYFPDSAKTRACENAIQHYTRFKQIEIDGGAAWIMNEFTSGSAAFYETRIDSQYIEIGRKMLSPAAWFEGNGWIAMLMLSDSCLCPSFYHGMVDVRQVTNPNWVENLPRKRSWLYACGMAERSYFADNSWQKAEARALIQMAETVNLQVETLEKLYHTREEVVRLKTQARLTDVQIAARWLDWDTKIQYVLLRMPFNLDE